MNLTSFKFDRLLFCKLNQSYGEKWSKRRKLITPTFHFEILNDFLSVMNEQSEILVQILNESAKNKQEINIYKKIGLCSLDIICGTN